MTDLELRQWKVINDLVLKYKSLVDRVNAEREQYIQAMGESTEKMAKAIEMIRRQQELIDKLEEKFL